jgi:hypothetical protein
MGDMRNEHKFVVEKPLGKRRRRWEDNIRMDLRETSCEDVNWIHLAQERDHWRALVNTVMNFGFA